MSEFEFDELIEVSDSIDFINFHTVRFMADFRTSKQDWFGEHPICVINPSGVDSVFKYARKIESKVRVSEFGDID
jgi:hypothetical protein